MTMCENILRNGVDYQKSWRAFCPKESMLVSEFSIPMLTAHSKHIATDSIALIIQLMLTVENIVSFEKSQLYVIAYQSK